MGTLPDVDKYKLSDADTLKVNKWLDEMYGKNPGNILTKFVHWQISSPGDHHPAIGPWAAILENNENDRILRSMMNFVKRPKKSDASAEIIKIIVNWWLKGFHTL